jgi:hypothetical protein
MRVYRRSSVVKTLNLMALPNLLAMLKDHAIPLKYTQNDEFLIEIRQFLQKFRLKYLD